MIIKWSYVRRQQSWGINWNISQFEYGLRKICVMETEIQIYMHEAQMEEKTRFFAKVRALKSYNWSINALLNDIRKTVLWIFVLRGFWFCVQFTKVSRIRTFLHYLETFASSVFQEIREFKVFSSLGFPAHSFAHY